MLIDFSVCRQDSINFVCGRAAHNSLIIIINPKQTSTQHQIRPNRAKHGLAVLMAKSDIHGLTNEHHVYLQLYSARRSTLVESNFKF